jgi:hypothetical protein
VKCFMEKVTPRLEELKSLSLDSGQDCNETEAWIGRLKPLTSLIWLNGFSTDDDMLDALLGRHGSTLERLKLRYVDMLRSRRPTFSPAQLERIGKAAPRLKSLSIDVNRNET